MVHDAKELTGLGAGELMLFLRYLNRRLDEQQDVLRHARRWKDEQMDAHYTGTVDVLRRLVVEVEYEIYKRAKPQELNNA